MELKIEDLVSSIKKEGIDAANEKAEQILNDAKKKADEIIKSAEDEAEKIKAQAKSEIEVLKESAKVATLQAGRDAVLLFEEAVKKKFEKILSSEISKTVNEDALVTLIKAALTNEDASKYTVEVKEIGDILKSELAKEIKDGMEIKISPSVKTGFRLSAKDGSGYFDCSNEEIADMLAPFLPEITF